MTTKQKQTRICELSDKQCKLVDALFENRITKNMWQNKHDESQVEIASLNNDVSKERLEQFKRNEL
mgnify:CR=1 FL=1